MKDAKLRGILIRTHCCLFVNQSIILEVQDFLLCQIGAFIFEFLDQSNMSHNRWSIGDVSREKREELKSPEKNKKK